jgi:FdhD protein
MTVDTEQDVEDLPRPPGPVTRVRAVRYEAAAAGAGAASGAAAGAASGAAAGIAREEHLATEEPLEIRVGDRRIAVTMRTPGADFELAVGWLHAEGVVAGRDDVRAVRYCTDAALDPDERFNVVTVDLADPLAAAPLAARSFVVSSACGVCGRDTLDDLHARGYSPAPPGPVLQAATLAGLPQRLRDRQSVFERTGGLHAAGLFDLASGQELAVREDVGRHNAVDKVVGWALMQGLLPLSGAALVVSGRTSYELCQKAVAAGVPALVSVSAPSSLAVGLASSFGLTLAGFARDGRITVYAGHERLTAR